MAAQEEGSAMAARPNSATRGGRGKKAPKAQLIALEHGTNPALDELMEMGKEQGFVSESDIDDLFADDPEPPDPAHAESIRQAFLDAGIEIVHDEAELAQTIEDI